MTSCTMWLGVPSPPCSAAMTACAPTVSAPIAAVVRGPANEAVSAGAMTSAGPRWMSSGKRMSTTVIATMSAIGSNSSARPDRPGCCHPPEPCRRLMASSVPQAEHTGYLRTYPIWVPRAVGPARSAE
ncbi:hypothetical protein QFZ74_000180 [Streptomyces sp. V3I7]|nr:hypothetical protein [Streptomyces sp. V3I7]